MQLTYAATNKLLIQQRIGRRFEWPDLAAKLPSLHESERHLRLPLPTLTSQSATDWQGHRLARGGESVNDRYQSVLDGRGWAEQFPRPIPASDTEQT